MFREKQRDITITKEELIEFESNVVAAWEAGKIRGPIHLSKNNEDFLIDIFQYVNPNDWVFSTWRNHYHALLHGVPKENLMDKILDSKSISFQSPEHHLYTSAIVCGIIPIAVGTAMALKRSGVIDRMVWCFVGDMAAESGIFYEGLKFSIRNDLPIHFVIEDNGLSTNTPTQESWGTEVPFGFCNDVEQLKKDPRIEKYITYSKYERSYPHTGCGIWLTF